MIDMARTLRLAAQAGFMALLVIVAGCATGHAQSEYEDVPVLVVGEDHPETTVKLGTDIYKRVIGELRDKMKRRGFRVLDEESVMVDLGGEIQSRRTSQELKKIAKQFNSSKQANHRVRVVVLFRIHAATHKPIGGAFTNATTRLDGEIIDIVDNEHGGYLDSDREEYVLPRDCNNLCVAEHVGDRANEISANLGTQLGKKLSHFVDESRRIKRGSGEQAVSGSEQAATGESVSSGNSRDYGISTSYMVTLKDFARKEALTIIGVMADEFPGYRSHTALDLQPAIRKYEYVTLAKPHKLDEWLTILLDDMNFDVENDVEFAVDSNSVTITSLNRVSDRPRSEDEKARFK